MPTFAYSILQDGSEMPTRLSAAAADCLLALTEASTKMGSISGVSDSKAKSVDRDAVHLGVNLASIASRYPQDSENMGMKLLIWNILDELIVLLQKLLAWSMERRPLHAKGLKQVLKWLQEIKQHYDFIKDEAGEDTLKAGVSLISSCWKHYCLLLRLVDRRVSQNYLEMLNQYISGIKFYMNDYTDEHSGNRDGGLETIKFFMTCLSLLLGRLDSKQFESAISECGMEILRLLLLQLQCDDEDVIEGTVSILRATILKTNCPVENSFQETTQLEEVFPLLLIFLDERNSAAKAVIPLTAELCSINADGRCLKLIFERLASGNFLQRRNAIDVVSEIIRISSDTVGLVSFPTRQDMATHLLDCLGDEEITIRLPASNVLPMFDPPLVMPELVRLVYSPNEGVRSSASDVLVTVLKCHNQNPGVMVLLLDCLSKLSQAEDLPKIPGREGKGSQIDTNQILRLIPEWSKGVKDWEVFIGPLVEKMFADPSNAITVRFLSSISEHLVEASDFVLRRVLLYMQGEKEMDELMSRSTGTYTSDDFVKPSNNLFHRLCPLLILRLLPLKVFNDLNSPLMYGQLLNQDPPLVNMAFNGDGASSIAAFLVNRAFQYFEFEDVRKLAAELCGRIHPHVLFPIIRVQLENATRSSDILKMKACLFSVCTSLALRGRDSALHPLMNEIRKILEVVLLWPSMDGDEVSKAQHGCIDCLALMICAELQSPGSTTDFSKKKMSNVGEKSFLEDAALKNSVLTYVIDKLTNDTSEFAPVTNFDGLNHLVPESSSTKCRSKASIPLSFRLCMANVLISTCQKIASSGKNSLAERTVPVLTRSIQVITDSIIRAACIQVLFSAVYHLKSAILPHSSDLLTLSMKALQKGTQKEKMAAIKLTGSLLASEDVVVESISGGLSEARSVLSSISSTDPSLELRQLCKQLLACITSPLDNVLRDFLH
ncbi:hypothetical protein GIB67_035443 [Kingdonia uniflora]|uniref:ARM repeat superfamily protein n=1 Tax=Kingdonia uniflora TaxID=39325 RepID=A0A7J7P0B2_9MAGN|nr:hypothetical protein GIB67_035443 [Kingdonia uniflora]